MARHWSIPATLAALLLVTVPAFGAPSLNLVIEGAVEGPGVPLTLSLAIKHASMSNPFSLPRTPGLVVNGSGSDPRHGIYTFFVTPSHAGDYLIPGFDIHSDSGQLLHVNALRFHIGQH